MSRRRAALVILGDVMLLIALVLLFLINQLVNGTLYSYGLIFSSDWNEPYTLMFGLSLVLIVVAIFLTSVVELPYPAFQEDQV
jgi:hypothetical protein